MLKKEIRNVYKEKRNALSEKEYYEKNELILTQFQTLPIPFIHNLLSYFPIDERKEPDTFLITRHLKQKNLSIQVAYPRIKNNETIIAVIANEDSEYEKNKFGIYELDSGPFFNPKDIDLVLVPLLAFDRKGNRIGFGKGYYDKYLSLCKPDVIKIGLSYFEPLETIEDVQDFDVPLSYCITTDKVYAF